MSAIFESVSNAQKLSPSLQIWTIGSFISQLHVCHYQTKVIANLLTSTFIEIS
jgi:hypothetical protein